MKTGERVYTPRFCTVRISDIFESEEQAKENGYTEPTYYKNDEYGIRGKSTGFNTMEFAAFKK